MIQQRQPGIAQRMVEALTGHSRNQIPPCLAEAESARQLLQREGFADCPSWPDLARGLRPETPADREP
eukprot:3009522-Karenia_brevis.AAC.1